MKRKKNKLTAEFWAEDEKHKRKLEERIAYHTRKLEEERAARERAEKPS
jgi:hypothetical protein